MLSLESPNESTVRTKEFNGGRELIRKPIDLLNSGGETQTGSS